MQINNNVTDRYFYASKEPIGKFQKSTVTDRYFYASSEPIDIFQSLRKSAAKVEKEVKTPSKAKRIFNDLKKTGVSLLKADGLHSGLNKSAFKASNICKMI